MARRFAYLTPDTNETQTIVSRCLSVPLPLLPHVVGALSELTNVWQWEQFGTMTPEDAAQLATVMLNDFSDECNAMDCSDVIACLIESGLLSGVSPDALKRVVDGVPQYSFDDGTTWVDMPLNGDGTPFVPALTPTAGVDDDAKICLAATRASLVINELYGGVFGALGAGLHNALNTFSSFLRDLNSSLLGLLYGEGWQVLNAEILRDTDLTTNYVAPSLASGVIDELRCLLVSEATVTSAGIVTFDYAGVRDSVVTATNLIDGAAIWGLLGYIGESGLNVAGSTHITDTAANCAVCDEPWCYTFDFTASQQGWSTLYGAYYSGNGWSTLLSTGTDNVEATIGFTGVYIDRVVVHFALNWGGANPRIQLRDEDASVIVTSTATGTTDIELVVGSYLDFIGVNADKNIGQVNAGFEVGQYLSGVTVYGYGTNPFGMDNC